MTTTCPAVYIVGKSGVRTNSNKIFQSNLAWTAKLPGKHTWVESGFVQIPVYRMSQQIRQKHGLLA